MATVASVGRQCPYIQLAGNWFAVDACGQLVRLVGTWSTVSLYSASGNWLANLNLRLTDSGNWVREVVEALGVWTRVVLLVEIDPSLRSEVVVEPGRQRRHIHAHIIFNTDLLLRQFRRDISGVPVYGRHGTPARFRLDMARRGYGEDMLGEDMLGEDYPNVADGEDMLGEDLDLLRDRCWVCDLHFPNIHTVTHGFGMADWHPRRGMFTSDDQFAVLGPLLQWLSQEVLAWSSPVELCGLCSRSKAHLVVPLTSSPREQWMRSYVQMLRIDGLGLAWCECVGGAGDMVDREEEALDELLRRRRDQHRQEGARVQDALALANFEGVDLML